MRALAQRRARSTEPSAESAKTVTDPRILSSLVGRIYDAAVDPRRWPAFLGELQRVFHAEVAALYLKDGRSVDNGVMLVEAQDPALASSYAQGRAKFAAESNPAASTAERAQELITQKTFDRAELNSDWTQISGTPRHGEHLHTCVSVVRAKDASRFADSEMQLFQRLVPHIERAIVIHGRLCSVIRQNRVTLEAVEDLALGVLLLDRHGRLLFANKVAEEVLDRAGGIVAVNGSLRVDGVEAMARLSVLLSSAAQDSVGSQEPRGGAMAVPLRSGAYLSIFVCPYRQPRSDFGWPDPAVMIFVSEQQRSGVAMPAALAQLYRLTPAEARLASALLAGRTLAAYAEEAGITSETARGYLKAIFNKTGMRRQADLASALACDPVLRLAARHRRN